MTPPMLIERTAALVAAYVSQNSVPAAELPVTIERVYEALLALGMVQSTARGMPPLPTDVDIKASIKHDRLISFIDGKPYKSLKRHLTSHGMTPEQYRARYNLPRDYPMVSSAYTAVRSRIAVEIMLGRKAA